MQTHTSCNPNNTQESEFSSLWLTVKAHVWNGYATYLCKLSIILLSNQIIDQLRLVMIVLLNRLKVFNLKGIDRKKTYISQNL